MSENAMRGMDISSYEALKNAGVKYYDNDGNEESLLKVLHDQWSELYKNPYLE